MPVMGYVNVANWDGKMVKVSSTFTWACVIDYNRIMLSKHKHSLLVFLDHKCSIFPLKTMLATMSV